ncbi:hypothetical protein BJ944DRAFT_114899 [Cunninghamella echinulata]|nr:hypothetical protein BJ944DRAFT_114899 [Cunninghamella echinulata]
MLNSNRSPSSLSTTTTSRFMQSPLSPLTTKNNNISRPQSKLNGLSPPLTQQQRMTSSSTSSLLSVPGPSPKKTTSSQSIKHRTSAHSENVKVAVRCRPLSQKEFFGTAENAWNIDTKSAKINLAEPNRRQTSQASNEYLFGT